MPRHRVEQILLALIDGAQLETIINQNIRDNADPACDVISMDELNTFERIMRHQINGLKDYN